MTSAQHGSESKVSNRLRLVCNVDEEAEREYVRSQSKFMKESKEKWSGQSYGGS